MKLLKFSASWCQPCTMLSNIMKGVDLGVEVIEHDIDNDESSKLAQSFGVRGVPTLILMDGDKEVKRRSGMMMEAELVEFVKG